MRARFASWRARRPAIGSRSTSRSPIVIRSLIDNLWAIVALRQGAVKPVRLGVALDQRMRARGPVPADGEADRRSRARHPVENSGHGIGPGREDPGDPRPTL